MLLDIYLLRGFRNCLQLSLLRVQVMFVNAIAIACHHFFFEATLFSSERTPLAWRR